MVATAEPVGRTSSGSPEWIAHTAHRPTPGSTPVRTILTTLSGPRGTGPKADVRRPSHSLHLRAGAGCWKATGRAPPRCPRAACTRTSGPGTRRSSRSACATSRRYGRRRSWRRCSAAQWGDGRIPHIVFNPSVPLDAYFPSPDFWRSSTAGRAAGAPRTVQTSGIVQPPVHALAAWLVHCADPGLSRARGFLARVYPRLAAWHRLPAAPAGPGRGRAGVRRAPLGTGYGQQPLLGRPVEPGHPGPGPLLPPRRPRPRRPRGPADGSGLRAVRAAGGGLPGRRIRRRRAASSRWRTRRSTPCSSPPSTPSPGSPRSSARPATARHARAERLTAALVERLWDPAEGMFLCRDVRGAAPQRPGS